MRFTIDQDFDFSVVINDFSFLIVFLLVIRFIVFIFGVCLFSIEVGLIKILFATLEYLCLFIFDIEGRLRLVVVRYLFIRVFPPG